MPFGLVALIVFGFLVVEARRAAANERAQRSRGGVEPAGDVYQTMRVAYPAAFAAMMVEGVARGAPRWPLVAAGAAVFAAAKALKWWAIATLGANWTFRVIIVPKTTRVTRGPYRFLRHPNYVAVVGELVSVSLATGAFVSGPIATAGFLLLLRRRIATEERALDAILRPQ